MGGVLRNRDITLASDNGEGHGDGDIELIASLKRTNRPSTYSSRFVSLPHPLMTSPPRSRVSLRAFSSSVSCTVATNEIADR